MNREEETTMTLGQKLQQLRKRDGLSQEGLAEKVAVTRQTISKWELDQSTPDLQLLAQLAELFHVSTDYLIKPELAQPEEPPAPRSKRRLPEHIRPVAFAVLTGAALAAGCICLICDYFSAEGLFWSWIAIASIAAGWLLALPVLTARRGILLKTLAVTSVVPFPLLAVLALCLERSLVFTLGSCIALVSIAAAWLIYGIFCRCRERLWRSFGFALLVLIPLPIAIMLLIARFIPQAQLSFDSSLFNSAITLLLALGCFWMDHLARQRKA